MEKNTDLSFKPITEGLGFHPFSNGLPYAPISKVPTPSSTTTPSFVPPPRPTPSQMAPQMATRITVPVSRIAKPIPKPTPAPMPAIDQALKNSAAYGWGYLFKRVLAYFSDSIVNVGLCTAALSLGLIRQQINPEALFSPGMLVLFILFLGLFNWALITAQEVAFGTTLGKRIFGLTLEGSASAILTRSFLFVISTLFFGIGLLWSVFDSQKRCWHDIAVNLQPEHFTRL